MKQFKENWSENLYILKSNALFYVHINAQSVSKKYRLKMLRKVKKRLKSIQTVKFSKFPLNSVQIHIFKPRLMRIKTKEMIRKLMIFVTMETAIAVVKAVNVTTAREAMWMNKEVISLVEALLKKNLVRRFTHVRFTHCVLDRFSSPLEHGHLHFLFLFVY